MWQAGGAVSRGRRDWTAFLGVHSCCHAWLSRFGALSRCVARLGAQLAKGGLLTGESVVQGAPGQTLLAGLKGFPPTRPAASRQPTVPVVAPHTFPASALYA